MASMVNRAVSCVVPARWASSRFPGKMLHPLAGIPIVLRTLNRARDAACFSEVLCLTDSEKILSIARKAGFRAEISGPAANGTDRIARNLRTISNDLIVNLQGDEPVFPVEGLRQLCRALREDPASVHVLVHDREPGAGEAGNPNRCKAGLDAEGRVRDFYRAVTRHPDAIAAVRLQMGAYGYAKPFLRRYAALPVSPLELSESHELLRDLSLAPVKAHGCAWSSQAIDVPQDLEEAGLLLARSA